MIVLVIILIVLVALLGYLLYINYKRAEIATKYCEAYVQFISTLYYKFTQTRDGMKEIDRIGSFKADDEVGVIFTDIDESIDNLYEFITKYVNANQTEKSKKTKD